MLHIFWQILQAETRLPFRVITYPIPLNLFNSTQMTVTLLKKTCMSLGIPHIGQNHDIFSAVDYHISDKRSFCKTHYDTQQK